MSLKTQSSDPALALAQACADEMYRNDLASRSLGITIDVMAPGQVAARMTVTEAMVNGYAICHGGYIFTLCDSAFAFACNAYNRVCVAASAHIDFIAPVRLGDQLLANAVERSRGGRSGLYAVEVRNQEDRLVAIFSGRSATLKDAILPQNDTENLKK